MEEISCRGARIIEFLVESKLIDLTKIPTLTKAPNLWKKHKEDLGNRVCSQCSFRANDCDFQSEEPSGDLEPCGGFILLSHLKENNLIDETDMEHFCE
ncbi:MAG: hypothetical protein KKH97_00350 [Proteobacteria bacterium]|nr:hypothetical protein [Pseudomonadota bacterium]MBU1712171.1 hypothetical protein [Pseudomonadota bacterium]